MVPSRLGRGGPRRGGTRAGRRGGGGNSQKSRSKPSLGNLLSALTFVPRQEEGHWGTFWRGRGMLLLQGPRPRHLRLLLLLLKAAVAAARAVAERLVVTFLLAVCREVVVTEAPVGVILLLRRAVQTLRRRR